MEFGFGVPTRGPLASPENLIALAQSGEEFGFDFVSVSDHIVVPRKIDSTYPYNPTGEFASGPGGEYAEQLTVLAFLAAQTSRIRLLTSVMVVPHRNPVHTAKILSTIDVLSNGRLTVGCGAGWMREEFEALGAPPFDRRGSVTREYILAFKELWTSDDPRFDGEFCAFRDIAFAPKPVQKPHPPIWTGGESPAALRRAGEIADAWYPIGSNPRFPMDTVDRMRRGIERVREYAAAAGRDPAELDLSYSAGWYNDREAQTTDDGHRRIFTGTPQQVAEDIRAFEGLGVRHFHFGMQGQSLDESRARMERFATQIKPLVA